MDPDVCRNCGHSGKHIEFRDFRCAITERDDAERDKLQADAALERARQLCESSLSLMKRQMQELEDANAAIETLSRALAAAEDRRERIRRDLGAHGDVCLTARSNLEAAEEMAISAAGRYFEAGRAVTALEDRDEKQQQQQGSPGVRVDQTLPQADEEMKDGGEDEETREREDRKWQRSNERFCKWLRRSEAQRQIMKSSWTKVRVAERLATEGVDDDEELARRNRVQEWAAARRLTDQLPPEDDPTMETEYLESEPEPTEPTEPTEHTEPTEPTEPTEQSADLAEPPAPPHPAPKPAPAPTQLPSPIKTASTRRAAALRTRAKTSKQAATAQTGREPDSIRTDETGGSDYGDDDDDDDDDDNDGGDDDYEGEEGAQDDAGATARGTVGKDGSHKQLGGRRAPSGGEDESEDRQDPGTDTGAVGDCGSGPAAEGYEEEVGEGAAVPPTEHSAQMEMKQHMFLMRDV
ncbi:putative UbiD family decarboxylase [Colletotrichum sublineola]|uniref:Putative UbiD family decarboxylase n=1 Tax=Colletotrichum sublineola TaxID=1173701 RepID=A0A066XF51_COLSU|nr:putative UbiD family decarboxylase [Colletotrichum sublineola]